MRKSVLVGLSFVAVMGAWTHVVAATPSLDLSSEYTQYTCRGGPGAAAPGALGVPEPKALTASQGRATRKAGVLTVGAKRFADNPADNDNYAKYRYRGAFAQPALDVVEGNHYEWTTWTLVDPKGATHEMQSPPVASPDGAALVGATNNSGQSDDVIEIVSYAGGKFTAQTIAAAFPCDPRWIDRDTIELKILPNGAAQMDEALEGLLPASAWKKARVVRKGATWTLVPGR